MSSLDNLSESEYLIHQFDCPLVFKRVKSEDSVFRAIEFKNTNSIPSNLNLCEVCKDGSVIKTEPIEIKHDNPVFAPVQEINIEPVPNEQKNENPVIAPIQPIDRLSEQMNSIHLNRINPFPRFNFSNRVQPIPSQPKQRKSTISKAYF